ncbi:MAG: CHASE2 domain-containing protein [Allosphingosinicella sp.]
MRWISLLVVMLVIATLVLFIKAPALPGPHNSPPVRIVLIAIDERSLAQVGPWPWPRSVYARVLDALARQGVQRVAFDIVFSQDPSQQRDDAVLARALGRFPGQVAIGAIPAEAGPGWGQAPAAVLVQHATVVALASPADEQGVARAIPCSMRIAGRDRATLAAFISGRPCRSAMKIAWETNPASLDTYSVADVLAGDVPEQGLRGRTVVVGATAKMLGDRKATPTGRWLPGVYLQIFAAT